MKALFITFLLVCSASAFANNGDNTSPVPAENNTNTIARQTVKATAKQSKAAKPAEDADKRTTAKQTSRICDSNPEAPGYGIGSYFVEFVHKNNIRLIKFLSED